MSEVSCSKSSNICLICSRSSLKRLKDIYKNAISTLWIIRKVSQKLYYDFMALVFLKHSASRSSPPQDLLSHINVSMVSFLQFLLLPFHFCVFLSQLSELVWKLAEEISLQSASKCFQSFGPPVNGNKSNAKKSRFCPNRNLTGTIYHWSVILRSFTLFASFDFATSCPKIKIWCMRSNGIVFL